jgi:hypothetical protein
VKRRLALAALAIMLWSCSEAGKSADDGKVTVEFGGANDGSIDCALDGAGAFLPACTLERAESEGKQVLIVRHPDGGFRRFEVGADGQTLDTADGIEDALVTPAGAMIEVKVGFDRYRLPPLKPSSLKGNAAPR